jgi:prepilin-type N-terminal cleavage/methylation domain-containing protein
MSRLLALRQCRPEKGFTLVELMIAIVVIVIGVLGIASTTATMIRFQDVSAARTDMAALADNKFEDLRGFASARALVLADTSQLTPGGSLTVATAGYNDVVTERGRTYTRLWLVTIGVGTTRNVTLRITPQLASSRGPQSKDFNTLITMNCGAGTC